MAVSAVSTITDAGWSVAADGEAETLLTSDGNGFVYLILEDPPSAALTFGHVVNGWENEAVITLTGETLYVRSRHGAVTLIATVDAAA